MTSASKSRKSVKPETRITKLHHLGGSNPVLGITKGALTTFYTLERIVSELGGVAFQLTKAHDGGGTEPDVYHVLLNGIRTSCTCPGHSFKGKCKHVDALEALIKAGKIEVAAVKPPEAPVAQQPAQQEPGTCWEPGCNRPGVNGPYCELHNFV